MLKLENAEFIHQVLIYTLNTTNYQSNAAKMQYRTRH